MTDSAQCLSAAQLDIHAKTESPAILQIQPPPEQGRIYSKQQFTSAPGPRPRCELNNCPTLPEILLSCTRDFDFPILELVGYGEDTKECPICNLIGVRAAALLDRAKPGAPLSFSERLQGSFVRGIDEWHVADIVENNQDILEDILSPPRGS